MNFLSRFILGAWDCMSAGRVQEGVRGNIRRVRRRIRRVRKIPRELPKRLAYRME